MRMMIFLFCSILSVISFAAIYQTSDTQGNTVYSDSPKNEQSQIIQPPKTNEISTLNKDSTPNAETQENNTEELVTTENKEPIHLSYKKFEIASPHHGESIQNQPTLPITVAIEPNLQTGDTIQIFLDGSPWGEKLPSNSFSFTAPNRGTHYLKAKIYNAQNEVIKETPTITIYVHQAHI